jgi:CrcB protein
MSSFPVFISVFLAGGSGAVCRYGVSLWLPNAQYPWATWLVNVLGSFLIGLIATVALSNAWSPLLRLGLITGFLGGFTTFSAFSLETLRLQEQSPILALGYVLTTVVLCIVAARLGVMVAKVF